MTNYSVWVPAMFVNFLFVPPSYQVPLAPPASLIASCPAATLLQRHPRPPRSFSRTPHVHPSQVLFSNGVGFGWNIYISAVSYRQTPPPNTPTA